ncbi:hypothetical protein [Arenimonas oryziterrae]|uniref:Uncharacterized protein n=1 Tax=Arenimonas oryziterrae DSM 21050 = YC6267 TaxID=1121015 RepID=A0A091ALL1_9GAMM|nr:hypothetical protein [Arenimonas oryziterrae]KFN41073.1 hypothetical protein N789_04090 [Arenimonas oryziterrae DSM 21050 = YC6267]
MNAGTRIAAVLIALASLGLGACSTTLVETLPAGKRTTCDASWPGRWEASSPAPKKPDEHYFLEINADCSEWNFIDTEKADVEKHTITLISSKAGDFISISSPDDKPECLGTDSAKRCGVELMRYERTGDEIRIYQPDHVKVNAAIAAKTVQGLTEQTGITKPAEELVASDKPKQEASEAPDATPPATDAAATGPAEAPATPTYRNLLLGNGAKIAEVLRKHPEFFESTPWLILRRDTKPAESNKP